jgi:hypothetical protein
MWLLKLIEWVDTRIDRAIEWIWCPHEWEFQKKVREQNLRSGHAHDSHVFRCVRCGKLKTVELPPEHA